MADPAELAKACIKAAMQAKRDGAPEKQLLLMERAVALQPDNAKIKSQHAKLVEAASESVLAELTKLKLEQSDEANVKSAEPPPAPANGGAPLSAPAPVTVTSLKRDEKDLPVTESCKTV
jgi:hypothetical protein